VTSKVLGDHIGHVMGDVIGELMIIIIMIDRAARTAKGFENPSDCSKDRLDYDYEKVSNCFANPNDYSAATRTSVSIWATSIWATRWGRWWRTTAAGDGSRVIEAKRTVG
jgi:hypothetical protein